MKNNNEGKRIAGWILLFGSSFNSFISYIINEPLMYLLSIVLIIIAGSMFGKAKANTEGTNEERTY